MNYIYFLPDVNDEVDRHQEQEDDWEYEPGPDHVPSKFVRLITGGVDPETAVDLADDGLPVSEPIDVAEDGGVVVEWPTMYEEVA